MKNLNIKIGCLFLFLIIGFPCQGQEENKFPQGKDLLLPELMEQKSELTVFTKLLQETGWDKALMQSKDEHYKPIQTPPSTSPLGSSELSLIPQERPFAFTVFAESDPVFSSLGISDAATLTAYLQDHLADNMTYSNLLYDDQYTNENHVANRFVSYHLLPQKLGPNQLVYHYNELNFDLQDYIETGVAKPTVPVYDYYATMGTPQRLLKVYESKESGGVRINRFVSFDQQEYQEKEVISEGIALSKERMYAASNGNVYLLDDLLLYDDQTVYKGFAQERVRVDIASISPELMNLGYRRLLSTSPARAFYLEPNYQDKIKVFAGDLYYLPGYNSGWSDYQGDELLLVSTNGALDILIELPPVSLDGIYQLRLGLSGNPFRSIVQYYWGDEDIMQPVGLPIDERTSYNEGYEAYGRNDSSFVDLDLILSQGGHMRVPNVFKSAFTSNIRDYSPLGRRIVGSFDMKADKKYYFRIKSVGTSNGQLFLDYLELVPATVFQNPEKAEDIW